MSVFITGMSALTGYGLGRAALVEGLQTGPAPRVAGAIGGVEVDTVPARVAFRDVRKLPSCKGLRPSTMTDSTLVSVAVTGLLMEDTALSLEPSEDEAASRSFFIGGYANIPPLARHLQLVHSMRDRAAAEEGRYAIDDAQVMPGMRFTSFDFLKLMNNMPGAHGGIQTRSHGPANTLLGYATSGLAAVLRGFHEIHAGLGAQLVVGGIGNGASPWQMARSLAAGHLEGEGLIPADGAGVVLLESEASLARRGGEALARLLGCATSCIPGDPGRALREAVTSCLDRAGLTPAELGLGVRSGCGVSHIDEAEDAVWSELGMATVQPTAALGWTEAASGPLALMVAVDLLGRDSLPAALAPRGARRPGPILVANLAPEGSAVVALVGAVD